MSEKTLSNEEIWIRAKTISALLSDHAHNREGLKWMNHTPSPLGSKWPETKKMALTYYPASSEPTRDEIYYAFLKKDPYELFGKYAIGSITARESKILGQKYHLSKHTHTLILLLLQLLEDPKFTHSEGSQFDDDDDYNNNDVLDVIEFIRDTLSVWIDGNIPYQINELSRLRLVESILRARIEALQKLAYEP